MKKEKKKESRSLNVLRKRLKPSIPIRTSQVWSALPFLSYLTCFLRLLARSQSLSVSFRSGRSMVCGLGCGSSAIAPTFIGSPGHFLLSSFVFFFLRAFLYQVFVLCCWQGGNGFLLPFVSPSASRLCIWICAWNSLLSSTFAPGRSRDQDP